MDTQLLVSYEFYTSMGYKEIPEGEFPRYSMKAQQSANYHCSNRITSGTITQTNQLGICELADFFYAKNQTKNGKTLTGFKNGEYSESYGDTDEKLVEDETDIIAYYFTSEQKYRGV